MKNKGFTLVEILAVIVIIGILVGIATLGYTRIRKDTDQKDLLNLHSSLETTYANYRTVQAMNGDLTDSGLTIDKNQTSDFDKYITDLAYNGKRLSKEDIDGTNFKTVIKGDIFNNSEYQNYVKARIKNFDSLSQSEQYKELEKQYIIDSTCLVESIIESSSGNEPIKHCKTTEEGSGEKIVGSKAELTCLIVKYKGETVINDYEDSSSFNKLCKYAK